MFCDPSHLGTFAVQREALLAGDGAALFQLLIAIAMFQRRQDVQIAAILRSLGPDQAAELTDHRRLLALVDASPCDKIKSVESLIYSCDLTKNPDTKQGTCASRPDLACHLKRHTVWMKRYGHFGKVPTSAALVVYEAAARDLADLFRQARASARGRLARAKAAEAALCRSWRVSDKIAAMFLSLISNPDLTPGISGWEDVDWRYYVVVDSNVDLFLAAIGYHGTKTYAARRAFIQALSAQINLQTMNRRLRRDNPRLVQQAMFLFMSAANRRALPHDCMHLRPASCAQCPKDVVALCPVRGAPLRRRLPLVGTAPQPPADDAASTPVAPSDPLRIGPSASAKRLQRRLRGAMGTP
ncbi:hypothetical protein WME97_43840 [Sorangium sp. So ce367]|uniref:hypothetical protein n=1 Tax=Sorangium sp. So ce367 TaxID=3133305 RepID=UPI003F60F0A4